MDERENYLRNDDMRRTEEHYQREGQRQRNSGGPSGCIVLFLAISISGLGAVSYSIYQFLC